VSIPNAEPFQLPGNQIAILMIHGFSGSPASIRPWAEGLNVAGYTVSAPRLPGHGTSWTEMNETTWIDWYREVEKTFENLQRNYSRIFLAGFSMGGALALHLAANRGREIEGLILVNPSIGDDRFVMGLVPFLKYLIPSIGGRGTDVAAPNPPKHSYGRTPLKALHSLQKLWRIVRSELSVIDRPLMIGYSIQDHVVDPRFSEVIIDNVASIDIREVIFENSYHNVALDFDLSQLVDESLLFIRDVLTGEVGDDELINDEFESIVAGLSLDESAPTDYLDQLAESEIDRYEGDNQPLPTLTQVQRAALVGVVGGPLYIVLIAVTPIDLLGVGFWPGAFALIAGVITFFWQMKPQADEGDGSAL
jgi:carboxylesterase